MAMQGSQQQRGRRDWSRQWSQLWAPLLVMTAYCALVAKSGVSQPHRSDPADIADGSILTSGGDSLVCFEKTGQRRWLFRFNRKTEVVADNQTFTYSARQDGASPFIAVSSTGLVYLAAADAVLYALDVRTGDLVWHWRDSPSTFESITYGDGRVYVSTTDFKTYALDVVTGEVLWGTQFRRVSSWTTGWFKGVFVRPDVDGRVWGVDAETGDLIWMFNMGAEIQYRWDPELHFHPSGIGFMMARPSQIWAYNVTSGDVLWKMNAREGYMSPDNDGDNRQTFEVWGDLVIAQDEGAVETNPNKYGILQALDVFTGVRVWIRDDVYPGKYGMVVTEGLLVYTTYIPDMSTLDVSSSLLISAMGPDHQDVWNWQRDGATPAGQIQALDGLVFALQGEIANTTFNGLGSSTVLVALPATPSVICPPDVKSPPITVNNNQQGTNAVIAPPPPPFVSGKPFCWTHSFSYKPLGSPTSDGVRAYGQDNAGLVIAVYLDTGAIAWKATCGPDSNSLYYPSNVVVVDGVVYLGCSNLDVQARDAATGHLLWRRPFQLTPDRAAYRGGIIGNPAVANGKIVISKPDGFLQALNITNGQLVWSYDTGILAADSVGIRDGVAYAIARHNAEVRYSTIVAVDLDTGKIGRDGGDLAWNYPISDSTGVYSVLVVSGEDLGLPHDALFYNDNEGLVTALALGSDGPTEVMWTVDLTDARLWPGVENLLTPGQSDWAQITYSNQTLYVPTTQGMFVVGATNGEALWSDLRSRLNANIHVIERPGGPQVIYGRYLSNFESNTPQCRPPKPSGLVTKISVRGSVPADGGEEPSTPTDAPAPDSRPVPVTASPPPSRPSSPAAVAVALGLSGLPYNIVKADSKLRDRVAGAVEKLVSGKVTGFVRVRVLGVESTAGGTAAVLRLSLQRSGGASATAVASAIEDAALNGKLQEVVLAAKVPAKVRSVVLKV
eukprot:XP_001689484.1 quinoprotein [Chlamydomonas reinhardtii]